MVKILDDLCYLAVLIATVSASLRESVLTETASREAGEQCTSFPVNSTQNCQVLDENGCLLAVNDVWLQTMGYTREEVIGGWFGDYLYPPDISLFTQNSLCVGRTGEIRMIVVRMARSDDAIITVSFKAVIGHDEYGLFRQIHCAFEDITDFIRFDVVLENEEEQFRPANAAMGRMRCQNLSGGGRHGGKDSADDRFHH